MNESIVIVKDAFSLDFCNRCRDISTNETARVANDEVAPMIRKSNIRFLDGYFNNPEIYTEILSFMRQANDGHFQFNLTGLESPQLTEYDAKYQGEYKPHRDNFFELGKMTDRKLSMIVQITPPDCYEGGEIMFPEATNYDVNLTKSQGTAIVFPSYLLHGVKPVTGGVRKSLVCWAIGPAFR